MVDHTEKRLAHNLKVRFEGIDGKTVINSISQDIAISAGSACTAQSIESSHVLLSLACTKNRHTHQYAWDVADLTQIMILQM